MTRDRDAGVVLVDVPGDKSITHRLLMLGAVAAGTSRIRGALVSEDTRSTGAAMRTLGCDVPDMTDREMVLHGRGWDAIRSPSAPIDCGNSGTTVRLLMGMVAGRAGVSVTFSGDESLRQRPMGRVGDPLGAMGSEIRYLEADGRLPVEVRGGRLTPIEHRSPRASAQIKSAVLLAGLSAGVPAAVLEPIRSRDHTERILRTVGADITTGPAEEGGWRVELRAAPAAPDPFDCEVPGDLSSAAFPAAFAAMGAGRVVRLRRVGVNPTRTGFIGVLRRMGALVTVEDEHDCAGEPVADLRVGPGSLTATDVAAQEVPAMIDELPAFAVLASRADGESRVRGAGELRVKESDRIAAIVGNLRAVGVEADETSEGFAVLGTDRPPRGRVRTFGDHRIAMAFGLLGALPGADVEIDRPHDVGVSYPGFWEMLREVKG